MSKAFFKHLACEILHDENFSSYFQHEEMKLHKAEYVTFSESFERAKIEFAACADNQPNFLVEMPSSFYEVYEHKLKQLDENCSISLGRRKHDLYISYMKFEEFMCQLLDHVKKAIDIAIAAIGSRPLEALYLTGGLGGSQYIVSKVRSSYGDVTSVIVPESHMLATVHGACHYFNKFPFPVSKSSFGIGCSVPYDDSNETHHLGEKLLNEEDRCYCSSVFLPLLNKNERIDPLNVYRCVLTPMYHKQSVLTVTLYSSSHDRPTFVLNTDTGETLEGVSELASLDINIEQGMDTLSLQERQIQVTVRFGSCEIIVTAEYNGRNGISTIADYP